MKRKAQRHLPKGEPVVIRDTTDDRYPHLDEKGSKPREERGRWMVMTFDGCYHDGLRFLVRRHFAYLGDDGVEWDFAERLNNARPFPRENPWQEEEEDYTEHNFASREWNALPEQNRAWFEVYGVLPYESVLDIDEKGDEYSDKPHIYTTAFDSLKGPFTHYRASIETIEQWNSRSGHPDDEKRVKKFARKGDPLPEREPFDQASPRIMGDDEARIAIPED